MLFEMGVHHFDLLWFLLRCGPKEIFASSSVNGETATVVARLEEGAQVIMSFSEGTAENHEFEIYGERGWLRVSCYRADGLEQFAVGQFAGAISTRDPQVLANARPVATNDSTVEKWRRLCGFLR